MPVVVTDNKGKTFLVDFQSQTRVALHGDQAEQAVAQYGEVSRLSELSSVDRRRQAQFSKQIRHNFGDKISLDVGMGFKDLSGLKNDPSFLTNPSQRYPAGDSDDMKVDYAEQARLLFPWMPPQLVALFAAKMAQFGGEANLAIAAVRQDPTYDTLFPGNRRDDGSLRLTEQQYFATVDGYKQRINQFGLDPEDVLRGRTADLISGDVSPAEFEDRLNRTYTGIIQNIDQIRGWYAEHWGADGLSDAAIFASAINPDVGAVEFQARISQSQIGGEADQFGFDINAGEANRMFRFGLDQQGARSLYAQAEQQLPRLNQLIDRFNDPDDEMTLEEFSDAVVINDPSQLRQIARLFGRSRSAFSQQSRLFEGGEGRLTGLLQR